MPDSAIPAPTTISKLSEHVGSDVTLRGWLYNKRSKGKLQFLILRDGSGIVQAVVFRPEVAEETWAAAESLTQESSCIVSGTVRADERAPGGYELTAKHVEVVQVAPEYPISPKEHGVDFLMSHRHLWLRSKRQHAIIRIRAGIVKAMRNWMDDNGFVLVDAPILTPAACEGTSTLFETDYFDTKAYLTQSGQLYAEAAAMAFGRVYTFGPTFRAEKSKTRRHLTEFWMLEPEMVFCDLDESIRIQETFVSHVVQSILQDYKADLADVERDASRLEPVKPPFPRITYDEAIEILRAEGSEIQWGADFGGTDETILAGRFDRPVFVTHYPKECKAFYMKEDPARPEVVKCADLIAPEGYGEIIGGSQREDDLDKLMQRMAEHDISRDAYEWYLDLRRYGSVPHSGFGIGLERTVAWICGLEHVRETAPFPRMLTRIYP
ncbi:MAG: asparagine--tRNA ligase [Candidatus Sericytochromatia bacterium]|uniref:Asparagine--tRNA ligase n=1 Tax=Candidatus Tanganyikabacteria bacterium TaxID=2961651 RepID=A0A937X0N0_9BACT|nr:asparagine--tRNA ligase [Candidatus Tanganyikabacteria bacterium]